MPSRPTALLLLFSALLAPAAAAQSGRPKPIEGTLSVVAQGVLWTEHITGAVRFEHDQTDPAGNHTYRLTSGALTWWAVDNPGGCTYTGDQFGITLHPERHFGILHIFNDGTYNAAAGLENNLEDLPDKVQAVCPGGSASTSPGFQISFLDSGPPRPLDPTGTRLTGEWNGFSLGGGPATFEWDFTYAPDSLKLVVEIADYQNWMPSPGLDEYFPGDLLQVSAVVLNADGSEPSVLPESFRFEMAGTSREPGVALNFPTKDKAKDTPDLRFVSVPNELEIDPDSQWVRVGPEAEGSRRGGAQIGSFDGGAFTTLHVTALLEDGRTLTGKLEAWGNVSDIRLPRRKAGSKVADRYKELRSATGLDDVDDSEAQPVGDGHAGDGLTLYEEYRGFFNGGVHTRTNPHRKTLLIRDDIGGAIRQGTALFRRLTGLEVLDRLAGVECDTSRVINGNHAQGDHVVDQHALWLRYYGMAKGEAVSVTDAPGPPRHILHIELPGTPPGVVTLRQGARRLRSNPLASITAHELLHGSNVWHHGDRDLGRAIWRVDREPDGQARFDDDMFPVIIENAVRTVQPRWETGERYTPYMISMLVVRPDLGSVPIPWVALEHGQHSGHENCVMRYDATTYYGRAAGGTSRYEVTDGERRGMALCTSIAGTGVNDPGRKPQPRYADADQDSPIGRKERGRCDRQLCINDLYH